MKSRQLSDDLAALAVDPAIDRATLAKVTDVLGKHSGRITLKPWTGRAERRGMAISIATGLDKPDAVKRVVSAVGVSESTARRYLKTPQRKHNE